MIQLYGAPMSSAGRTHLMLEEIGDAATLGPKTTACAREMPGSASQRTVSEIGQALLAYY